MNLNRLVNMGLRMIMRKGINAGISTAANRGKSREEMTPQERRAAKSTRSNAKGVQRGMRTLRRFMR